MAAALQRRLQAAVAVERRLQAEEDMQQPKGIAAVCTVQEGRGQQDSCMIIARNTNEARVL